ncbi:penicillin-binding protein 1C [Pyxidicoccus fallax]|uniref:peptidoglycan glycosyltransferase n=2 Tax=Pyxidicoccus fallax TaxID=394095 RepID=A0A848LER8_9BACT|nr:penicillin-binding protein 1C [Pyxidicoccus fallax]NMO15373.1 penicillin-binding protein 1C [Pyxidicoccus fallax]NPC79215.1 penicillin-binding protein 1C [Pyxidicoccus fallax]
MAVLGLAVLYAAVPRPPVREGLGFSQAVFDREGRLLRLTLSPDEKYRLWVPLERIPQALVEATLLHEDQHFRQHFGVNPVALGRAVWSTYLTGGRRMGGSTLTMQLARIRYGIESRTPAGKVVQMLRALQLECTYSKDEILEAYLNLAPYGRNVEGVGAASLVYFGRDVEQLTLAEALTLAVVPQSPARRDPGRDAGALTAARLRLFDRWVVLHPEDAERRAVLEQPLPVRAPEELPFLAPHFVGRALRASPAGSRLRSTLDLPLQKLLERHLRQYVERRRAVGIRNAAAMLVDWRSLEVRAAVGSVDFFDEAIDGQVDGTQAKRSPGSALKPFIYGLAFDQGLLHPRTMVKDASTGFRGYDPGNFDGEFVGPLAAEDALVRSRNIPAVALAKQLAAPGLYGFLKQAGITGLKSEEHYGLSLSLGSAGVSMVELVELYAMLANGGLLRPLRVVTDAPRDEGVRLLSAEASFMVLDGLEKGPRPSQPFRAEWTRDSVPVAWKTGTSTGFRDAWSVGVVGPYVVAVWVGNFDGQSNPAFVGQTAAAPLMFELVDSVRSRDGDVSAVRRTPPPGLSRVHVCALTGGIPGPHCHRKTSTWFIPGTSPIRACDVHREILVDTRTGLRSCAPGPTTRAEVFEFWPSDLLRLFQKAGLPRRVPPREDASCGLEHGASEGTPPRITTPEEGVDYNVRASATGPQTVPLVVVTDADVRRVFWFVDEQLVGTAPRGEPLHWAARPGTYIVRAVDDRGRSDVRTLRVRLVD